MKEMGIESKNMDNATISKMLHNLLYSVNFCGLCFENGGENSFEHEVEAASDAYRSCISLGEMYTIVFREKPEDLASNIICKSCMEQLKESYNFIQNSKSVTKILYEHVDKLNSNIIPLIVQLKKSEEGSKVIIKLDYEESNNTSQVTVSTEIMTKKSTKLVNEVNSVPRMESHKCLPVNIIKIHPETKQEYILICRFCSEPYKTFRSLQEYVEEHSGSSSCSTCLKCRGLTCQECETTCIHSKHLIHFQEQIQRNSKAKCLDCDFTCREKKTMMAHINKHHFDNQLYKCDCCSINFYSKRSLETHIASHGQLFKCYFCGLDMDDKSNLEAHKKNCQERKNICKKQIKKRHENLKKSQYGQVLFKNSKKIEKKTHVKSKIKQSINTKSHSIGKNPEKVIKNNSTLNPSKLQWEKSSGTKLSTQTKEVKKQKPYLPCEHCHFIAWNSVLLECHMNRYHLHVKPYVCHICSKDFVGKHLLKKHIKVHTVDRSVTCTSCGKKLANPSCLKSHLKLHTGEKNYLCDICGEKFRSSSIMNVHRVKKHTEKDITCPLCPRKFFTLVEMRRHVGKTHWKKETKFDPRKLEGLENHYHLFHDGRRIMMNNQDVDFYLPC